MRRGTGELFLPVRHCQDTVGSQAVGHEDRVGGLACQHLGHRGSTMVQMMDRRRACLASQSSEKPAEDVLNHRHLRETMEAPSAMKYSVGGVSKGVCLLRLLSDTEMKKVVSTSGT